MVTEIVTGRRIPPLVAKKKVEFDPEARHARRSIRSTAAFLSSLQTNSRRAVGRKAQGNGVSSMDTEYSGESSHSIQKKLSKID